jgi:Dyp-type peroxidase family
MNAIDLHDIQGIIVYGYGKLAAACFVLLQITDARAAKGWLGKLGERITSAEANPSELGQQTCLNIAFTHDGLKALGLEEQTLAMFSREFQEGMTLTEHRQRLLGDWGESAPERWQWGGSTTEPVHILLMLYGIDEATLELFYQEQAQAFASGGIKQIRKLDTYRLPKHREHFGFRDDVADPAIAGTPKQDLPENTIKAGEFILGYPNGYEQYTERPLLATENDPQGFLPDDPKGSNKRDLGRNGSYLVFRQLHQDVRLFWQHLEQLTQNSDGSSNPAARLLLASKMVGRWPNGTPLVASPESDNPDLADKNDFLYHAADPHGFKCPLGAHIRRVNPRDSLPPDPGSRATLETVNRHRILRRGRTYGQPVAESMEADDVLQADAFEGERGIHFICFNANISRQFEFIQHTWINNPKFHELYSDDDPLIGDRYAPRQSRDRDCKERTSRAPTGSEAGTRTFTQQAIPVRKQITGLPRFVEVRGGGYFFMPGIAAVRFLASLP